MNLTSRFNENPLNKKPLKGLVCLVTLVAFLCNTVLFDSAWAVGTPSALTGRGVDGADGSGFLKELHVGTFSLPEYLGHIEGQYKANNSDKVIIHIQDAHCNYIAQHKISEIVEYINKEYGISIINLEGGAKGYDLSIFTDISDNAVRNKVADYFVGEGIVSGAESYAINNPKKISLWGIEDAKLYIDNLKIYRESLKHKYEIDKHINALTHILGNLKSKIYSPKLLELDDKYFQYKSGSLEFKAYLSYLIKTAEEKAINIKSLKNIYLLNQMLAMEGTIDFRKANNWRDELLDKLRKRLSKNELEELILKTVEFKSEKISQRDFYVYIVSKAKSINLELNDFPELQKYISYISTYNTIDKIAVMDEVDSLESNIKEIIYRNDDERELNKLSRNLSLLKNLFNITLAANDYKYYKANENSFSMRNYILFIESQAPLFHVTAKLDEGITNLDLYREEMSLFYEYSFKRDMAFIKNIKFQGITANQKSQNTILVTGGFHAENLYGLLRKQGISYISIMPNFKTKDGYSCPYFALLSGNRNNSIERKITTLLTAAMAIASPFTELDKLVRENLGEYNIISELHLEVEWAIAQAEGNKGIVVKHGDKVLGAIGERDKPLINIDEWNRMDKNEQRSFKIAYATQLQPNLRLPVSERPMVTPLTISHPVAQLPTIDPAQVVDTDIGLVKGPSFKFSSKSIHYFGKMLVDMAHSIDRQISSIKNQSFSSRVKSFLLLGLIGAVTERAVSAIFYLLGSMFGTGSKMPIVTMQTDQMNPLNLNSFNSWLIYDVLPILSKPANYLIETIDKIMPQQSLLMPIRDILAEESVFTYTLFLVPYLLIKLLIDKFAPENIRKKTSVVIFLCTALIPAWMFAVLHTNTIQNTPIFGYYFAPNIFWYLGYMSGLIITYYFLVRSRMYFLPILIHVLFNINRFVFAVLPNNEGVGAVTRSVLETVILFGMVVPLFFYGINYILSWVDRQDGTGNHKTSNSDSAETSTVLPIAETLQGHSKPTEAIKLSTESSELEAIASSASVTKAEQKEELKVQPAVKTHPRSLIGKLLDRNGNVATSFNILRAENGRAILMQYGGKTLAEVPLAMDLIVDKNIVLDKLTRFFNSRKATMPPHMQETINRLIDRVSSVNSIVALEHHNDVRGAFYEENGQCVLYLNKGILNNPLALIHELGEGALVLPKNYKNLTRHTLMRGAGKDVRNAFDILGAARVSQAKTAGELIKMIKEVMEKEDFIMSKNRSRDSPITKSEKDLIRLNFENNLKGKEILFGIQDFLSPEGNIKFTQDIRNLNRDLRQGALNIFLMRSRVDVKSAETAIGRNMDRKLEKVFGVNTRMQYFEDKASLTEQLTKAINYATAQENKDKLPKIFVDCLTQDDWDVVNAFKDSKRQEYPNIDNIIAIGRDFIEGEVPKELPDEVKIILVGSAIMNDRRLKDDFKMLPQDLFEGRKRIIDFLVSNKIIDETAVADDQIDLFFSDLWRGAKRLLITRINWKEFQDWKNAQDEVLRAL